MTVNSIAQPIRSARELPPTFWIYIMRAGEYSYSVRFTNHEPFWLHVRHVHPLEEGEDPAESFEHNMQHTAYDGIFYPDQVILIKYRGIKYRFDAALAEEEVMACEMAFAPSV